MPPVRSTTCRSLSLPPLYTYRSLPSRSSNRRRAKVSIPVLSLLTSFVCLLAFPPPLLFTLAAIRTLDWTLRNSSKSSEERSRNEVLELTGRRMNIGDQKKLTFFVLVLDFQDSLSGFFAIDAQQSLWHTLLGGMHSRRPEFCVAVDEYNTSRQYPRCLRNLENLKRPYGKRGFPGPRVIAGDVIYMHKDCSNLKVNCFFGILFFALLLQSRKIPSATGEPHGMFCL